MLPSPLGKIKIILTHVRQINQSTPKSQNLTHPTDERMKKKKKKP
jgi:hypothetical protein